MKQYLVRQPIFDGSEAIIACELLHQQTEEDGAEGPPSRGAQLVMSLLEAGIQETTDGDPAVIAIHEDLLAERTVRLLPVDGVILQVSADLATRPDCIDTCEALTAVGYTLAVDRFRDSPELLPLLQLATYVKIDAAECSDDEIEVVVRSTLDAGCQIIATNVNRMSTWEQCRDAGVGLFQGRFFRDPDVLTPGGAPPEATSVLRLLTLVRDPDNTDADLEEIFKSDPTLTFKLLKIVNSAAMGGRGIDSIGHALRLLGREALYRWLSVLLVTSVPAEHDADRERALTALLRARFLESLGEGAGEELQQGHLFLAGLFSMIDVVIGVPKTEAVTAAALPSVVRHGVLNGEGPYGAAVSLVEAYEAGDWTRVSEIGQQLLSEEGDLSSLYLEAVNWCNNQVAAM